MSIYSSADSSELMLGVTKRCLGIARLAAVSHSRDGHSFSCKCSIPSSYPASHCPGIASILVVPAAIEVPALVRGGSARAQNLGRTWVGGHVRIGRRIRHTLGTLQT